MGKVFEDYFSELQADMISICLEYVEKRADKIYVYCSFEEMVVSCDFFYCINSIMCIYPFQHFKKYNKIGECFINDYIISVCESCSRTIIARTNKTRQVIVLGYQPNSFR